MKSDIDIKQDMYLYLMASDIKDAIGGEISYTGRDGKAATEDCIISVLDNEYGQIQDAYVNVNIYVQNINSDGRSVENVPRLKELCSLCERVLGTPMSSRFVGSLRFYIEKQLILPVNGKNEHVINNKVRYKQSNDYNYARN